MPQLLQRFAIARLPVAETKVLAHENRFRPECADYDAGYELFGRQLRDRWRKGQDLDMSNAGDVQQTHPFFAIRDLTRNPVRGDHSSRVRIKRQNGGLQVMFLREPDSFAEQSLVATMDAIEIADGEGSPSADRRSFAQRRSP
jgi:hypothetical protein